MHVRDQVMQCKRAILSRDLKLTPARPEVDFVVFRGTPEDTTPYVLKGHVILMTNDSIQNKSVKITFKGKRRTS
jgi:hypothetical protein